MANIQISELAGSALFSDSETYMDSMRELTKDELKIRGGSFKLKGSGLLGLGLLGFLGDDDDEVNIIGSFNFFDNDDH
jgi:hypothetical protein